MKTVTPTFVPRFGFTPAPVLFWRRLSGKPLLAAIIPPSLEARQVAISYVIIVVVWSGVGKRNRFFAEIVVDRLSGWGVGFPS
jgi:hypothetical protein